MDWDWQSGVIGDAETRAMLSSEAQLRDMLRVEAAFSRALGDVGAVAPDIAEAAAKAIEGVEIDHERLVAQSAIDGMPVPDLVRQLKENVAVDLHLAIHAGLTSQDVMDTALMLAMGRCLDLFGARLRQVEAQLSSLIERHGDLPLMGRTRMQAALSVTLGHRLEAWRAPIQNHFAVLHALKERVLVVQLGGPVGTGESFDTAVEPLRMAFAAQLGLGSAPVWHTDRTRIMELGAWLARVAGSLGKMGQDVTLMAQQGLDELQITSGGSSSAMAHKVNPVQAEVLVALGRDASAQLGALHLAMEHEQERSGAAWSLEWLTLPRLLEGTGAGLARAGDLIDTLAFPGDTPDR